MTERWQRELGKLRGVSAPRRVRQRIEEGPHGDRVPPMAGTRQRVLAGLVAFGVFAAAGAFALQAFSGEAEPVDPGPIEGSAADEPADALRVRCDATGIEILTPVVAAQIDGLHVDAQVTDLADPEIGLMSTRLETRSWWSGSSGTDDTFVRPVPVGEVRVVCEPGPEQGSGSSGGVSGGEEMLGGGLSWDPEAHEAVFELVDPNGHYVDYVLPCEDQQALDAWSTADTLEAAVRAAVAGLLPDDVIEEAGYPMAGDAWPWSEARVVRSGVVAASFHVGAMDGGYSLLGGSSVRRLGDRVASRRRRSGGSGFPISRITRRRERTT